MKVRGFTTFAISSGTPDNKCGEVELWEQPFLSWAMSCVYNWYDMRRSVIVLTAVLQRVIDVFQRVEGSDPIAVKQDLRCYWLSKRKQVVLHKWQVTWDELVRITPEWNEMS